jgi:heat shock protein HslJ
MTDEQMDARLRGAGEAWRRADDAIPAATDVEQEIPLGSSTPRRARRSRRTALFASAAVVAAALVAGGAFVLNATNGDHRRATNADMTALEGTVWRLIGYGREQQQPNSTATLVVDSDGTFVADDACEVFGGKAEVYSGQLSLTPRKTRLKMCTDSAGEVTFDRGLDALVSLPSYSVVGNQLTITHPGTPTMYFQSSPDLPRPTLDVPTADGASWRLVGVKDGRGADRAVRSGAAFKIDNEHLVASDTCNTLSGDAAVTGHTLTTGKGGGLALTAMACEPDVMNTAAVVDAVLSGDATITVSATTMTISRTGAGTLTYQWVPDDKQATDPKNLVGRTWHLSAIAGSPAAGDVSLHVSADGSLTGRDGCAAIQGRADVTDGALTATGVPEGPPASCEKATADQATTVDSFLNQKPALWAIRGGKLLVYGGGAQAFSLVFEPDVPLPTPTPTSPSVTGKKWTLTSVAVDSANSGSGSGSSDTGVTLALTASGYTLDTRCGHRAGSAQVRASTIVFDGPPGTGNPCKDEMSDQTIKSLDGTVRWSIDAGELTLTNGDTTLTFDR